MTTAPVLQLARGILGADDRRNAQLARHDRGMAGAAAAIGDDGAGRVFITGSQSGLVVAATSTSPVWKAARSPGARR